MKLIKYDNSVSVKVAVPHLDNRIGKEHQLSPSCLNYTNNIVTFISRSFKNLLFCDIPHNFKMLQLSFSKSYGQQFGQQD